MIPLYAWRELGLPVDSDAAAVRKAYADNFRFDRVE